MGSRRGSSIDSSTLKSSQCRLGVAHWQWHLATDTVHYSSEWKNLRGLNELSTFTSLSDSTRLVHSEDIVSLIDHRNRLVAGQCDYYEYDHRVQHTNGHWIWISERAVAVVNTETDTVIIDGCDIDISARKVADSKKQSDTKSGAESLDICCLSINHASNIYNTHNFEQVVQNVPGMVYRYISKENQSDQFTYTSPHIKDIFELDPEHAMTDVQALWKLVHKDDLKQLIKKTKHSLKTLVPLVGECRIETPIKGMRWVQYYALPTRQENGDVVFDGITIETTDRNNEILNSKNTQAKLDSIEKNLPGLIYEFEMDSDGTHSLPYLSAHCIELFGIDSKTFQDNQFLRNYIYPEDKQGVIEALKVSAANLTPLKQEYRVLLPDNDLRWVQDYGQPRKTDDNRIIWDGFLLDITDSKATKEKLQLAYNELEKATKMKDEFLATMSHELRTPLNAVLNTVEGLKEGIFDPLTNTQKGGIDIIGTSGLHLLDLINEILDFAKLESRPMVLHSSVIQIDMLSRASLALVRQQADKKHIQLDLRIEEQLPELIADSKRVKQILVNLLSNAVKFTPDYGEVSLSVATEYRHTDTPVAVSFTVTDSGIGINKSQFDSIFLPFYQIDNSLSRNYPGTGLGLSLVKRYTELHGGHVSIESEPGQGTTFTVTLHCSANPETSEHKPRTARAKKQPTEVASGRAESDRFTVLLTEDNESVVIATKRYLKSLGYKVFHADNGYSAIDMATKHKPDVILMDIQMPGMDGLETIRRIRAKKALRRIPVIAVTGLAMPGDEDRCLRAGANQYICKPYSMRDLVKLMENLLTVENA